MSTSLAQPEPVPGTITYIQSFKETLVKLIKISDKPDFHGINAALKSIQSLIDKHSDTELERIKPLEWKNPVDNLNRLLDNEDQWKSTGVYVVEGRLSEIQKDVAGLIAKNENTGIVQMDKATSQTEVVATSNTTVTTAQREVDVNDLKSGPRGGRGGDGGDVQFTVSHTVTVTKFKAFGGNGGKGGGGGEDGENGRKGRVSGRVSDGQ